MSADLLLRAARCFLGAGLLPDAGRCFEAAGQPLEAARCHERLGAWAEAAGAYERAAEWLAAARCHQQAVAFEAAAACWERGGDLLEAAWLLAHELGRPLRAGALVERWAAAHSIPGSFDSMRVELVQARCEATGANTARGAARRLRAALPQLGALASPALGLDLVARWLAVAAQLRRPDLQALVHAAAWSSSLPGAAERWEGWALATFGDASGVPSEDRPLGASHWRRQEAGVEAGTEGGPSG